eukprot:5284593-Pleurochrysis_carterae.AAC.2
MRPIMHGWPSASNWQSGNILLDCRPKENNRVSANKWLTGERWATFCARERGSPGAPIVIATLVMIIANDLQVRGVQSGSGAGGSAVEAEQAATPSAVSETDNPVGGTGPSRPQVEHVPKTAAEPSTDPEELAVFYEMFGSRAQTLINVLLPLTPTSSGTFHLRPATLPLR